MMVTLQDTGYLGHDIDACVDPPHSAVHIGRMREELRKHIILAEILPEPWGSPYILVPTHDVDNISARQAPLRTVAVAAYKCFRQKEYQAGINLLLAKTGLVKDPWDLWDEWMRLENELGIRSTFFIIPLHRVIKEYYHRFREISYDYPWVKHSDLETRGWEVAVHGMNNWLYPEDALKEGCPSCGNRTHWLHLNQKSFHILDRAGYDYDSTFGSNSRIGFPGEISQVFQPQGCNHLLELPLNIQDVTLFNEYCWILIYKRGSYPTDYGDYIRFRAMGRTQEEAKDYCMKMLEMVARVGGVLTISWHYENIVSPNNWRDLYVTLIKKAQADHAWIATAQQAVNWFRCRREAAINCEVFGKYIWIAVSKLQEGLPDMRVRLYVEPSKVKCCTVEYQAGKDFVDLRCNEKYISVVLK